ncbi:hypothetical protein BH10CYA1_BH10CYA1_59480 [soil metagenome]
MTPSDERGGRRRAKSSKAGEHKRSFYKHGMVAKRNDSVIDELGDTLAV